MKKEKKTFLNDAEEVCLADVNQEQWLIRKLLPAPALQSFWRY